MKPIFNKASWGKKALALTLASTLTFSMAGCGSDKKPSAPGNLSGSISTESVTGLEADKSFITSSANFSVELFKASTAKHLSENKDVLISPESVLVALSMAANGADGETLNGMMNTMAEGLDIETYNKYMYNYNKRLTDSTNVKFNIANSVWIRDSNRISVSEDFLKTNKSYYNADAYKSAFDNGTVDDINKWVSDSTNGMIPGVIDNIPESVVMYLINAIAFEGKWQEPYIEDQVNENGTFNLANGDTKTATMLSSTESTYIKDDNATGFIKYYEGGDYAFMAILPNEGVSTEEYINSMTGESFINMYNNRIGHDVYTTTPEFTYSYESELSPFLKSMGMSNAFDDTANFSKMANTQSGVLKIDRVIHKTYIQLDRNGTKAAAVTAISMTDECCVETEAPYVVNLDRPFVYAIVDTQTGLPIFIGSYNGEN